MTATNPSPGTRRVLLEANEEAAAYFRASLLADASIGPRRYLTDRGFEALLRDTPWTVGFAPAGWTHLRDHLRHLGFTDQTLLDAGLASTTRDGRPIDRFRDRLTFGIRDPTGDLVGFTARSAPRVAGGVPKYLNTPHTALYDKSRSLFGLGEHAARLRDGATPVLVEGPLDAIAVTLTNTDQARRVAPVSSCGTVLTVHQAALLGDLSPDDCVVVAFDRDQPGARAVARAYHVLRDRFASLQAVMLAPGSDPADQLQQTGPDGLGRQLTDRAPLATRIVDDYLATWPTRHDNAEAQIACLRGAARIVSTMTPADLTDQAARLPGLVNLSQELVTHELVEAAVRLTARRSQWPADRRAAAIRHGGAARMPGPTKTSRL
jgi:DNA primase